MPKAVDLLLSVGPPVGPVLRPIDPMEYAAFAGFAHAETATSVSEQLRWATARQKTETLNAGLHQPTALSAFVSIILAANL